MSDRLHVATRKGLFVIERGGEGAWSVARVEFLGDHVPLVLDDPRDNSLYAALQLEQFGPKLHRSRDGGVTWSELAVPEYPERPDGPVDRCPMSGIEIPWKLKQIFGLEAGGADQPGVLWCGTLPGGLFRSDDAGESWRLIRSLWDRPERKQWFGGGYDYPGIHSICVDPRDSQRIIVGVSCGGAWLSVNGGESWDIRSKGMFAEYMPPEQRDEQAIQDPHRVVQCRANPDNLWVQHHNGIFRTSDGGLNWSCVDNVAPSSFGFAVAVHPQQADTAWFVPAIKDERRIPVDGKLVVTRTRDGGRSFEALREGLPQDHAYDLVFRHALDIDESGERLAFGSTTGGLWISENQGDRWRCVAHHLPPIYCVQFARRQV